MNKSEQAFKRTWLEIQDKAIDLGFVVDKQSQEQIRALALHVWMMAWAEAKKETQEG